MYKEFDKEFILKVTPNGELLGSVRFPTSATLVKPELSLPVTWNFEMDKVIGSAKLEQIGTLIMLRGKLTDYGMSEVNLSMGLTWSTGGNLLANDRFQIKSIALRYL